MVPQTPYHVELDQTAGAEPPDWSVNKATWISGRADAEAHAAWASSSRQQDRYGFSFGFPQGGVGSGNFVDSTANINASIVCLGA